MGDLAPHGIYHQQMWDFLMLAVWSQWLEKDSTKALIMARQDQFLSISFTEAGIYCSSNQVVQRCLRAHSSRMQDES